jgi:hypothetical protein
MSRALVLLEPPSGAARPRAARRFGTPIFAIFAMLVPLVAFAQQPQVFYAVGSDGQSKSNALYEVDRAIFRAVRSVDVGSAQSGMLSANGRMIVLGDGEFADSTLLQVSAPDLVIKNQLDLDTLKVRGADCFDHIFVHPVTNLAYFSCDFGRGGNGFVILDTLKQAVVADFPHAPLTPAGWPRLSLWRPQFVYAQESRRLYLIGGDVLVLDPQNHPIDYILAHDVASAAGSEAGGVRYSIEKIAVLPEGKLALLVSDRSTPTLVLYDPLGRKLLQHWTETQKYPALETYTDSHTGKPYERSVQKIAQLHDGPVPSRDGSRLFAMSEGDVILWDSNTLEELDRFDAPEPPGGTQGCFSPAPDGRGMWFVGKSGKVYLLDDHTGHLIEEIKLPFRLINLLREP